MLPVVVLKENKSYLLASFSLKLLNLPSSTMCCPFLFVASQPISPTSRSVWLTSSLPSYTFPLCTLPTESGQNQDSSLSGVNRHSVGGFKCMTSLGSNPNIRLRQGSWEWELWNNSDGRYWQVFGLGEIWLSSHYRNDSSCKIIQFHCKVKYSVQNLFQEEVRHIFLWHKQSVVSDSIFTTWEWR